MLPKILVNDLYDFCADCVHPNLEVCWQTNSNVLDPGLVPVLSCECRKACFRAYNMGLTKAKEVQ